MQAQVPCVEWAEGFVQKAGVGEIGVTSRNGGRGEWRPRMAAGAARAGDSRVPRRAQPLAVRGPCARARGRLVGLYFTS